MMAVSLPRAELATSEADLTDEQMELLLSQAADRLKARKASAKVDTPYRFTLPKLHTYGLETPALITEGKLTVVKPQEYRAEEPSSGIRKVEDPVLAKKLAKQAKEATAGSKWFDLPKTKLTPELKRDLQLLKMRNVLDPHRHYKKDNGKMNIPEHSQVGTIVEGATEFYSGRLENRKRKRTFVEEVLAGEQETGRFKRKYGEVQDKKGSGKKAYYKAVQAKRKTGVKKGG